MAEPNYVPHTLDIVAIDKTLTSRLLACVAPAVARIDVVGNSPTSL
jgi:hypothetical protein